MSYTQWEKEHLPHTRGREEHMLALLGVTIAMGANDVEAVQVVQRIVNMNATDINRAQTILAQVRLSIADTREANTP
jgi:hypothetical protein